MDKALDPRGQECLVTTKLSRFNQRQHSRVQLEIAQSKTWRAAQFSFKVFKKQRGQTPASLAAQSCTWTANKHTTPVGFEPARGDPSGLARRRLDHSAEVWWRSAGLRISSPSGPDIFKANILGTQLFGAVRSAWGTDPWTLPSNRAVPGIEPGTSRTQRNMPLNHTAIAQDEVLGMIPADIAGFLCGPARAQWHLQVRYSLAG